MSALPHGACPVVLAAPSGTGKTTIARALVEDSEEFVFSVSATTRPARQDEAEGVDYHFVSEPEFRAMIDAGELVEWAEVHGHLYGTPRGPLEAEAESGRHVVMDIDVKGALQIRERVESAVLVFVFPPSADTLVDRLKGRGTEGDDVLIRRLRNAQGELDQARAFDYVVVNESLPEAVEDVKAIVAAESRRTTRAIDLSGAIRQLQGRIGEILETDFDSGSS